MNPAGACSPPSSGPQAGRYSVARSRGPAWGFRRSKPGARRAAKSLPTDSRLPAPSQSARGPSRRHRPTVASASALTLPPSAPTPRLQPDRPRCAGSSAQSAATTTRAIGQATSPSRGADGQASPEAGSTAPRRLGSRPTRGHPRPRQSPGGTEGHDVRRRRRNRRQDGCGSRDAGGSRSSRRQIGSPAHVARR